MVVCDIRFPVLLWGYHGLDLQVKLNRTLKEDLRE